MGRPIDDTISRQAAIEKLEINRSLFCRNRVEFQMLSKTDKSRVDEINTCIAELLNLPSIQRWTPVNKEEIPDGRYLCTYANEEGFCVDFGRVTNGKWYIEPIAYMPCPEPWKGES